MPRNNDDRLNNEFSDLIARLETTRPKAPKMPNDAKATLRARLMWQYPSRRRSISLIPITLALAATFIIVGLFVWFASPRPVSAAEIIRRASKAATDASAFGLKSYSAIKVNWYNNSTQVGQLSPSSQEHLWAKMPDLLRDEIYGYAEYVPHYSPTNPVIPDPSTRVALTGIFINDGSTAWWYNIAGKYAEKHISAVMHLPPTPQDLPEVMKQLREDNDNVTQLGNQTVAGREAYVLGFTPKSDIPPNAANFEVKVWIDKQTYIKLGEEYFDKQGDLIYKWIYTEFKPNVDISPDKFIFTPLPDIRVVDLRTPKDEADLAFAWRVLALSADFQVFRPTNIPSNFIMERPHSPESGGYNGATLLEQNFYAVGEDIAALVLFEGKNTRYNSVVGTPIKVGEYDGYYYEEAGRRNLAFVRDGTWISLTANQRLMTKDELFQIAQAMELVSKLDTEKTPTPIIVRTHTPVPTSTPLATATDIPTSTPTPITVRTHTPVPTSTPDASSYNFTGTVTDSVTGAPVVGAVFHAFQCNSSQSAQAKTGVNGTYRLTIPAGVLCISYLTVLATGYSPQSAVWKFDASVHSYVLDAVLRPVITRTPTP